MGKMNQQKVEILVKALNGEVETYTLEIYKENSNTNLKKVTVDGKEATIKQCIRNTHMNILFRQKSRQK